eukprot:g31857.t1
MTKEKVKPMTAANPIKPPVPPETQAEDMPKALAEFPKIDWDKPLNKSLLSDSVKKFLKKESSDDQLAADLSLCG